MFMVYNRKLTLSRELNGRQYFHCVKPCCRDRETPGSWGGMWVQLLKNLFIWIRMIRMWKSHFAHGFPIQDHVIHFTFAPVFQTNIALDHPIDFMITLIQI